MHYPPLTHNIDTTNRPHVRLVTSSHSRRHSSLHTLPSPLLVVAHSSLTSRSLTGRGRRRCYPATIQYPGERRSKHCVRRRAQLPRDHAGVGDDVDTVAGSPNATPKEAVLALYDGSGERAQLPRGGIMHSMPAL